jgi:wyosine [tRNA(Phe)-imidazoG37] synthetase (radical SAM superfamily)
VVRHRILVWEETLGEADARRAELEGPGRSLLVSITPPGGRVCSFDCVFCPHSCDERQRGARWPNPGDIGSALASALSRPRELDGITISGYGEPTLHPRFAAVVAEVLAQARRTQPRLPLRILTNASQAGREVMRRTFENLDEILVKFDAAPDRVNRPNSSYSERERAAAISALRNTTLHSCFLEGVSSNCDPESVSAWVQTLSEILPQAVRIYTVHQSAATQNLRPAPQGRLREIAHCLRDASGIEAEIVPWLPRSVTPPENTL